MALPTVTVSGGFVDLANRPLRSAGVRLWPEKPEGRAVVGSGVTDLLVGTPKTVATDVNGNLITALLDTGRTVPSGVVVAVQEPHTDAPLRVGVRGATGASVTATLSGNEITDAVRATNTEGDGVTSPDSSMGVWEGTTNPITNGGAETNVTGWSATGVGATVTRYTSDAKFGAACFNLVITGAGDHNAGMGHAALTVSAGQVWTISALVKKRPGGTNTGQFRLELSTGAPEFGEWGQNFTPTDNWVRYNFTCPAIAAGVTQMTPAVQNEGNGIAYDLLIDGIQVEQKPYATPYKHTDGGAATRNAARVQLPASLLDETQSWLAVRLNTGFADTDTGDRIIFRWGDAVGTEIYGDWNATNNTFELWRGNGGSFTAIGSSATTFSAGTDITVIFAWTAGGVKVSVNGSAFASASGANIPVLAAALVDLGSNAGTANHINSRYRWVCGGSAALIDANAATIHANGNTDPDINSLPGSPTFVWKGETNAVVTPTQVGANLAELLVGTLSGTAVTTCAVSGALVDANGNGRTGSAWITVDTEGAFATTDKRIVSRRPIEVPLASGGTFSVSLLRPAALVPVGATYRLRYGSEVDLRFRVPDQAGAWLTNILVQ